VGTPIEAHGGSTNGLRNNRRAVVFDRHRLAPALPCRCGIRISIPSVDIVLEIVQRESDQVWFLGKEGLRKMIFFFFFFFFYHYILGIRDLSNGIKHVFISFHYYLMG
jgi:hypothetical protein